MSFLAKINFRRIFVVSLLQITLFVGLAFGSGHKDQAFANVVNRQSNDVKSEKPLNDEAYEELKAKRNEVQAERSKLASKDSNDENLPEKLNLEEPLPDSTKTFFQQVQGKAPLIDKTKPSNAEDYTTPRQE